MKILAKDIEVNQTVKTGNVWVKVESVNHTTFKNGNPKVEIIGTALAGVIKRANGIKHRIEEEKDFYIQFKSQTKVEAV